MYSALSLCIAIDIVSAVGLLALALWPEPKSNAGNGVQTW